MKIYAPLLIVLLLLAAGYRLATTARTRGDEKAHYAVLQSLEYQYRGKPVAESLPAVFVPSVGPAAGEAFLVVDDPVRPESTTWVALDRLRSDGNLFAVPELALNALNCADLRKLEVDRRASAQVAAKLYSFCMT